LAAMIRDEPDMLEKHLKLTDKEKKLILALAERSQDEGKSTMDATQNREELKSLETVVANAAMTLGKRSDGGKAVGFWQRLVTSVRRGKGGLDSQDLGVEDAGEENSVVGHNRIKDHIKTADHSGSRHSKAYKGFGEDYSADHEGVNE